MSTLTLAPKPVNFSRDPIMIELSSGAASDAENVTCAVRLYTSAGDYIARINPPYNSAGDMVTNIANLFGFDPPLPSLLFSGTSSHSKSWGKYKLYHSDRSGTPPSNEATSTSDEFAVVRGSSYNKAGFGDGSKSWYFLHSYYVRDHTAFVPVVKTVSPDQPEVYYFYSDTGVTINYAANIQTKSGASDYVTGSFTVVEGIGSKYLNLSQLGSAATDVVSYDITFSSGTESHTVYYTVDRFANDYERFILIENGCGGMECVRFAGRHSRSHEVSKQSSVTPIWSGYNHSKGQYNTSYANGGEVLELNTGYCSRAYIQHLEQILYSDSWVVDPIRKKLVKHTVVSNSANIHSDQDNKHNLTVRISPAFDKTSANTFGQ